MMIFEEPYFLKDDKWFYYDESDGTFKLTEEGLKLEEVKKSYDDFYNELKGGIE